MLVVDSHAKTPSSPTMFMKPFKKSRFKTKKNNILYVSLNRQTHIVVLKTFGNLNDVNLLLKNSLQCWYLAPTVLRHQMQEKSRTVPCPSVPVLSQRSRTTTMQRQSRHLFSLENNNKKDNNRMSPFIIRLYFCIFQTKCLPRLSKQFLLLSFKDKVLSLKTLPNEKRLLLLLFHNLLAKRQSITIRYHTITKLILKKFNKNLRKHP